MNVKVRSMAYEGSFHVFQGFTLRFLYFSPDEQTPQQADDGIKPEGAVCAQFIGQNREGKD